MPSDDAFHQAHAGRRLLRGVIADRGRVGFRLAYDSALVQRYREIFKRAHGYFAPDLKAWIAPVTAATAVARALSELDPVCFGGDWLTEQIGRAARQPARDLGRRLGVTLYPLASGGSAVHSLYDPVLVRAMHGLAAQWHPERRFWISRMQPGEIKEILAREAAIAAADIRIADTPVNLFEDSAGAEHGAIRVGPSAPPIPSDAGGESARRYLLSISQPLARHEIDQASIDAAGRQFGLYPHQTQAVAHLLRYSGCLLADDMGMGKTRSAAIGARLLGARTVVICPASLKLNWKREITFCGETSDNIGIIDGSNQPVPDTPWIILNYENLDALLRRPTLRGFTLIIDEAHYIKEPDSLRTRKAFELAASAARRFLLTATPMLNRPEEIYTLLKLSGHPAAEISLSEFKALYADSAEARRLLAERISEWILRRRKDEALSLPEKVRSAPQIDVPADLRQEYQEILADASLIAISKLTRLRESLERMKVPFIIEAAESAPPESKVVIFCQYKETVAKIAGQFGAQAVRFTGNETLRQRDAAIAAFQAGDARFFVATMEAGGVGINLTAASYVLFASRPLTPSVQFQAEDRCHRIGQGRRVEVIVPTVAGTIDEDIQKLLDEKQAIIEDVLAARLVGREEHAGNRPPCGSRRRTGRKVINAARCTGHHHTQRAPAKLSGRARQRWTAASNVCRTAERPS